MAQAARETTVRLTLVNKSVQGHDPADRFHQEEGPCSICKAHAKAYKTMLEKAKETASARLGRGIKYMRIYRVHNSGLEYRIKVGEVSRVAKSDV